MVCFGHFKATALKDPVAKMTAVTLRTHLSQLAEINACSIISGGIWEERQSAETLSRKCLVLAVADSAELERRLRAMTNDAIQAIFSSKQKV